MTSLLQDKDRRRAFLLSIFVHTFALFLLLWLWSRPEPVELDSFLVLDVGSPLVSEETTDAPTTEAPAPQASEPQVAAPQIGEPVAETATEAGQPAPSEEVSEAEADPVPEPLPAEAAEPQSPAQPPPAPTETVQPEIVQTPPQAASLPPLPTPAVQQPDASPPAALPDVEVTTTLPEIEEVELAPQPAAQALPIPQPAPDTSVLSSQSISIEPDVQVRNEQVVPAPDIDAQVEAEQIVPSPIIDASVSTQEVIPRPVVQSSVTETQAVPQPDIESSVSTPETVPQPDALATVSPAQAVPQPNVQSSVSVSQDVPRPVVQSSVTETQAVPQPNIESSVSSATAVPQPTIQTSVTPPTSLTVNATTEVSNSVAVPTPSVSALVTAVAPDQAQSTNAPQEVSDTSEASVVTEGQAITSTPGGNADTSGQTTADENASQDNLGLAAGPEGSEEPSGAPITRVPYRENRERPLAVMLDNLQGYPQLGLREASIIVEMPVEGGISRLMTVYDSVIEPGQVGPVRSAREYFHEVSTSMNGVLVHDGGSPGALAAIERSSIPSINAFFSSTELFQRNTTRDAPYNLYSPMQALRNEVARLGLNRTRSVSGMLYTPEETEVGSNGVTVSYSGAYQTGFRYLEDLNLYRWVRNGTDASDASGEAVFASAILIADIAAVPVPGDTEGRLYIPMRGGTATLYLRGKAISGRWDLVNGVQFTSSLGEIVDLTPFKTWIVYAPQTATVTQQ